MPILIRNRLYIFSIFVLSGCATPPLQQANNLAQPEIKTVATVQSDANQSEAKPAPIVVQPELIAQALEPAPAVPAPVEALSSAPVAPSITADTSAGNSPDVWQRIRKGFALKPMESKNIARFESWYARQPEYVSRMTDRARRYLYFIVEEVEKRGMPMEIALLPMIESAFNPGAYSSARASGIWQFIPSTGKNFGMQQNWWYDGRRDVTSATKGALDYLQKLHNQFGAWDLALAAYNAGENSVMRAQARNRKRKLPTNYASLKLPKETRQYVPKLLAVKHIVDNPESYGLVLTDIPNKPYFSAVVTTRHIDVEMAATMAGISMDEFSALNPAHNRPVILQKGDEVLLLPVEAVDTFQANLRRADQPLVSWQACPTKKGEDLDDIASRYGISIEKLKSVNGIHRSIKASNGQTLLVPLNGVQPETEFTAFNTHLPPTDNSLLNAIRHIVRKGDTLSGIARRYRVKLSSLKSWNRGVRILRPGQHILVAQPVPVQRAAKTNRHIKRAATSKKAVRSTTQF